jgi:hypothetical protein
MPRCVRGHPSAPAQRWLQGRDGRCRAMGRVPASRGGGAGVFRAGRNSRYSAPLHSRLNLGRIRSRRRMHSTRRAGGERRVDALGEHVRWFPDKALRQRDTSRLRLRAWRNRTIWKPTAVRTWSRQSEYPVVPRPHRRGIALQSSTFGNGNPSLVRRRSRGKVQREPVAQLRTPVVVPVSSGRDGTPATLRPYG